MFNHNTSTNTKLGSPGVPPLHTNPLCTFSEAGEHSPHQDLASFLKLRGTCHPAQAGSSTTPVPKLHAEFLGLKLLL